MDFLISMLADFLLFCMDFLISMLADFLLWSAFYISFAFELAFFKLQVYELAKRSCQGSY